MLPWLVMACSGPPVPVEDTDGDTAPPAETDTPPTREWVEVSTAPCARDSEGWVSCWHSAGWRNPLTGYPHDSLEIPDSPEPMSQFHAPNSGSVWGIERDTRDSNSWFCGVEVDSPQPNNNNPRCNPEALDAPVTLGETMALEASGVLVSWGNHDAADYGLTRLADLSSSLIAYLTLDGRFVVRSPWTTLVDEVLPRADQVVRIGSAGLGGCVLYDDGTVQCFGGYAGLVPDPTLFTTPPYRDLRGGGHNLCATRGDWTIECNEGTLLDFGPYRDLKVYTQRNGNVSTTPIIDFREGLAVCVITEDNAVRCHGRRYDYPDLQEALPHGYPAE